MEVDASRLEMDPINAEVLPGIRAPKQACADLGHVITKRHGMSIMCLTVTGFVSSQIKMAWKE